MSISTANKDFLVSLYVGYFKRAPDPAGLDFWIRQVEGGRALNTIALFIRRGSPPEYGTFGQMLSEAEEKLEEVEQGRQVIEYVLADIAGSSSVSGD